MNNYINSLIHYNNTYQRKILSKTERKSDWRYQIMDLSEKDLINELNQWSRNKMIAWLEWNDPNGIWSDEDAIAENYPPLTIATAKKYIIKFLSEK